MSRIELGTTLSQRELGYRNLDINFALRELQSLGITWVRLGCYWDEIEKQPNKYSFDTLNGIVKFCERNRLKIVMCLGMKSPRWPEFHIPTHKNHLFDTSKQIITPEQTELLNNVIQFNEHCVQHFGRSNAILVWQIENEGLDASGPNNFSISPSFLKEEIKSLKRQDRKRKIMLSLWGNQLVAKGNYKEAIKIADIVALDIYPRVPRRIILDWVRYESPNYRELTYVSQYIKHSGKEFWVAESQAEPWEISEAAKNSSNPPSFLPNHFEGNLNSVLSLNPKVIILWGFEYWVWRKMQGDNRYIDAAKRAVEKYT